MTSLAALLRDHPFRSEALVHAPDGSFTADEIRARVDALAHEFTRAGLAAGRAVAVSRPNDSSFLVAMFAIWACGGVFVPLNVRAPRAEQDSALEAVGAAWLFDEHGTITSRDRARTYASDVAFVLWTSGTTGTPKPIVHTHEAYLELLDRVLAPLRGGRDSGPSKPGTEGTAPTPNLIPVSLALNAGIYNALFGLRAGAAVVIMDRFATADFARLVARHAIRSTVLPPAAIAMLNSDASVTGLVPLRYVRSITAPLSPVQARRFHEKFGIVVLNGYGQAEIGEVIGWTAADAREHPDKIGAVGRAHPGVDMRLGDVDEMGVGRLWVRPPRMAAADASGHDLGDRIDADGFVDTGDLARIDDDGFVWIEGRTTDLINRGGHKVFPDHVEEVLRLIEGVHDAAVIAAPDERLGEVPVAFVVADPSVSDDELRDECRRELVPYKVPVAFVRVDQLPRNEVGKLLRRELVVPTIPRRGSSQ